MRQYLLPFLVGVALVAAILMSFLIGRGRGYSEGYEKAMNEPHKADTIVKVKTITIDRPVEVVKWKEREKPVYVPVDSLIYVHDTTFVAMEREFRKYGDERYEAQVSGIDPTLDWINVNQKTEYVTNTVVEKRRWSFGATLGPGVFYDFKEVKPGVGLTVGVTYNFR